MSIGFLSALGFLTRIPVPAVARGAELSRAASYFPLVGAGLGAAGAVGALALGHYLPSTVTAALVVAALAALTGAIHLDGLADTADGLGGGGNREDALRIMRDPSIGSYGAIAVVLDLIIKVTALSALVETGRATGALVAAGAISRWTAVPLAAALPYARPEGGLGAAVAGRLTASHVVGASFFTAAAVFPVAGFRGALFWLGGAGLTVMAGFYFRQRLGGVTGDTLGATIEGTETAILVLASSVPS